MTAAAASAKTTDTGTEAGAEVDSHGEGFKHRDRIIIIEKPVHHPHWIPVPHSDWIPIHHHWQSRWQNNIKVKFDE